MEQLELMQKIQGDMTRITRYISDREDDFNAWLENDIAGDDQRKIDAIQAEIATKEATLETLQSKVKLKASTVAQPTETASAESMN